MTTDRSPQAQFIAGAREHGEGTLEGDAPATNKAYKRLIAALRTLRTFPDRGVLFLAELLENENPSVVTWSALHLLPTMPDEAMLALQKVADTAPPLIAFGAETSLREWCAGRLVVE